MDIEPRRESLQTINPNENENAGDEDGGKQITDERSCIVGKVATNPPKEEGESGKDET